MLFISTLIFIVMLTYSEGSKNETTGSEVEAKPATQDKKFDSRKESNSDLTKKGGNGSSKDGKPPETRSKSKNGNAEDESVSERSIRYGGNALQQQSFLRPNNAGGTSDQHPNNLALDIMNLSPTPYNNVGNNNLNNPSMNMNNLGGPNVQQHQLSNIASGISGLSPSPLTNNNPTNILGMGRPTMKDIDQQRNSLLSPSPSGNVNNPASTSYRQNTNSGNQPSSTHDWLKSSIYNTDARRDNASPSSRPSSYDSLFSPSSKSRHENEPYKTKGYSRSYDDSHYSETQRNGDQRGVVNGCDVGGRTLNVGDTWSVRGICGLFTCNPNRYRTLETKCPQLQYQEGSNCVISEQDLNLDYPLCCPKLDCPNTNDSTLYRTPPQENKKEAYKYNF